MAQQVLEGTWEEIALHAPELAGKQLKLIVEAELKDITDIPIVGPPNEGMLAALREITERQKGRRETSGEDTQRIVREGRAGGMYGLEPVERSFAA